MTTTKEKADGDCFQVAAEIVLGQLHSALYTKGDYLLCESARTAISMLRQLDLDDCLLRLAHGLVTRDLDGLRHGHAWVEVETSGNYLALDFSNGHSALLPREHYYRLGGIVEADLRRYSRRECLSLMLEHETYGPWEERFNEYHAAA